MIMGEGERSSHDVDIILGGGLLGYKGGRRVKNLVKSDYVIISELSLILNELPLKDYFLP